MLDMREVENAIAELENGQTTYANVQKLANLYTVRAHSVGEYSRASAQTSAQAEIQATSDFLHLVKNVDSSAAWAVMDELMQTLSVISPKAYNQVLFKLSKL